MTRSSRIALLLLPLLLPLALTFYAWSTVSRFSAERQSTQFAELADEGEKALLYRVESYQKALLGGAGLFAASQYVSRAEWRRYVQAVDLKRNYPGINGFGWIDDVPQDQLAGFVERMRAEGEPAFAIHPRLEGADSFIITYIEPQQQNLPALGLNIAFEAHRRAAALWARDSGRATITRRIQLVQDPTHGVGFLLLMPIYDELLPRETLEQRRAAFRGWIFTSLIGNAFLAGLTHSHGLTLNLSLYDNGGDGSAEGLIYSSRPADARTPLYRVAKTITVGQQRWGMVWESTPMFEQAVSTYEPTLVLVGGVLLTTLFGCFLVVVARRAETVQQLVHERTLQLQQSQEALRASEATLRSAMEHASIGMALVAPSGELLEANPALCNLLGYQLEEALAAGPVKLTHPEDRARDIELARQALEGGAQEYQFEKRYLHKSGRVINAVLNVSLVRAADGTPQYFVAQVLDITQRKEMDRMKSEFISTVSHELRTPLTSIRGSLGLIAAGALGRLPQKLESMIRIAHSNSERLVRIINDILDIEKIESGKLELYPRKVPLGSFLKLAVEANEAYGAKFSVRFVLEEGSEHLEVMADHDRLMQVMSNLLSNAAKFSPSGSQVMVRAYRRGGNARVEVEDRGTGIPEEFRGRIFEKFAQADSSATRRFEGTGLGLAITRQLVEAMGGRIGFDTETGRGTTFHFELPNLATSFDHTVTDTAALRVLLCGDDGEGASDTQLHRVLHVEDDADLGNVIQAALAGKADVVTTATLHAARSRLRHEEFSLIVIDLTLPDGDGLKLLDDLGKLQPPVPVVILSASEVPREVRQRVAATLVKSRMSEARIVETILSLLRQGREARDAPNKDVAL